ncbi:MAG: winged helix-turn-helix domain-containing protein [Pseudomonadota bacterium]
MTLGISDEEFEDAIDKAGKPKPIDLARAAQFCVGPVEVVPSLRTVRSDDGETVIEPKVMQVLIALGEDVGTIFSRDDLIQRCWEGRVVGESSINRVISLLRAALKSVAGDTVKVENVPKVGYRLMVARDWTPPEAAQKAVEGETTPGVSDATDPVVNDASADTDVEPGHNEAAKPSPVAALRKGPLASWPVRLALLGAVALALVLEFAIYPSAPTEAPVEQLRVAMLPLKSGEEVDPLYARGLEAELRTQLARVGRLEVTSGESARLLYDKGLSADEICRKLGADYAWVGSLEVEQERVTLNARLVDAATQETIFDDTLASGLGTAQFLPLRTARAITTALGRPVSDRLPETPVTASDFQLYLTALGLIKTRGDDQRRAALAILEQITERNPDFADGWAGLSKAWFLLPQESKAEMIANRERAGEFARKALELDPDAVDAIKVLGMLDDAEPERRLALLKRATELDPGDPEAWFWRGMAQADFTLDAQDPLLSARRMVKIDPLWPATWRASELAAMFGRMEEAYAMEEAIASASATRSQELLSEARRARLQGDFSRFVELSREAQSTQTQTERRYGSQTQMRAVSLMLDIPRERLDFLPPEMRGEIVEAVFDGRLPTRRELAAQGLSGADFWDNLTLVGLSLPLFLRDGREAELAALYDAAFASHEDFLAYAAADYQAHNIIPSFSPYLALIFERLGRAEDAAAHRASAREQVDRWRAAETGYFSEVVYELKLAALDGDQPRAAALVERLPQFGWPYALAHIKPGTISILGDDPLYDPIRDVPAVQRVLEPIRENLARERDEVLALGG